MKTYLIKNRNLRLDFAVVLILSFSFLPGVSAQSKTITKEEIETVKSNARQKLKEISYRSVTTQQSGQIKKIEIYEFVPPDREHFIITQKSPEIETYGGVKIPANNFYDEWIYIGEKIYYRNAANKHWTEIKTDGGIGNGSGNGTGTISETPTITTEYNLTQNQFVNGQESDLYEVIVSRKYSWSSTPSVEKIKYWINKKGLFAKTKYIYPAGESTVDFEYNSKIKIEIPVIKKQTNKRK